VEIKIKSTFSGWNIASKEAAMEFAKFKLYRLRHDCGNTFKITDEERIKILNSFLQGVSFTIQEIDAAVQEQALEEKHRENIASPQEVIEKAHVPKEETKAKVETMHKDVPRRMQILAREQIKTKLLADLAMDLEICKLEGWDMKEYILELHQLIDSFIKK